MRRVSILLSVCLGLVALQGCAAAPKPLPDAAEASSVGIPELEQPLARPQSVTLAPVTYDAGKLHPQLQANFDKAVVAAQNDGVVLTLTSGYRSPSEQNQLYQEALTRYGSAAEATKWVAPPWLSHHVQGIAIDVGPDNASRAWLETRQERFGVCRRYANETWHFELKRWPHCPPIIPSAAGDD